ncbi:MAG: DNA ligase D [Bdellovibrionales bacterium]|nr:DNA ligase D [Bdellovibrionales bacterium]
MKKDLLKEYNKKRDFKITKEPSGKSQVSKKTKLKFVVQEHHASRLHYDLRLEWDGVLKSWAVPKGPSPDPADKRLAVQTEDHPMGYEKFHGTIPAGEYGGGEVFIWDNGTWEPEGDAEYGFKKGHLEFTLKGKKLHGRWHLIKTHYKEGSRQNNWLLIKAHDDEKAVPVKKTAAVKKKTPIKKKAQKKSQALGHDAWPDFISPQLPRLVSEVPEEAHWLHEMKFDGYRIQGHVKNSIAQLYTRSGLDWSNSFPHILEALGKLDVTNAIFDGEIVAQDEEGRSHFQRLQNSLTLKKDQDLRYYIFDIMYLNGKDLRDLPLIERKEILKGILNKSHGLILYSEHLDENGEDFYKVSCEHHLEGIVSKLADGLYRSGRNDLWKKIKCSLRQEFVIGGITEAKGGRSGFGALLVGTYEDGKLKYAGKVGTGFSHQTLRELKKLFNSIEQSESPFDINSPKPRNIQWVKPINVCEVSFANWTDEGILRAPVFLGMREDKPSKEIHVEKPSTGRKISSPDKIIFKQEKLTKQEVSTYYKEVAKHMLPYMKDRPLSLMRCPEGSEGSCFYQKHISGNVPEAFHTFPIMEDKGEGIYLSVDSPQGLQELVQLNSFEIHAWNCHRQSIMRPDQIVIDFDPGIGVPWKEVISAAFELKEMLDDLNLKSFVKLTGGKGLHVHIPVAPLYDWDQIKSFSQSLALQLVSDNPKKYTSNMSKKLRKGKIFVDYLRNGYGATAVVPYSLRAKPLSAVALPLEWTELKRIKGPQEYTLKKTLRKIKTRKSDPWKGMLKLSQKISILNPLKKAA